MKFAFWSTKREQATEENGLKILRTDAPYIAVQIWNPKAKKPFANYSFKTIEKREEYVAYAKKNFAAHLSLVLERKVARAVTPEKMDQIKINDVFYASWGYEQTNIDFYQVVRKQGKSVYIRPISSQASLDQSSTMTQDYVVPALHTFTGPEERKLVQFSQGKPYLHWTSYADLYLYDGKAKYQTNPVFGH